MTKLLPTSRFSRLTSIPKWYILFLGLFVCAVLPAFSQNYNCTAATPTFVVDLTGNPSGTWTSPPQVRNGNCCSSDNNCVQFVVTLDPGASGLQFGIPGGCGASPSGSLNYQVNCGPLTAVGTPLCLSGVGPHIITFCKPGNNANCYSITSIAAPGASPDVSTNDGCFVNMSVAGLVPSSVSWTSIAPGATGAYNSYLACTTGCLANTVTPQPGYPSFIDYRVCGTVSGTCSSGTFCDTVRVNIYPVLSASISPILPTVCFGAAGTTITANASGGLPPYTYAWSSGQTTQSIFVGPGTYSVNITDATGCPAGTASITVTQFANTITANAGLDQIACGTTPMVNLAGSVTGVSTGIWSGGAGTFSPSSTALNATYTPTASEIAAGFVDLTLSTTNNGSCPGSSDVMRINFTSFGTNVTSSITNVSCYGATNGAINITPTGGHQPLSFLWSNGATTEDISGIPAGNYTVTITDNMGCQQTFAYTITQPASTLNHMVQTVDVTCFGGANGRINLEPYGGVAPYTFVWSNGATTEDIMNLAAGTYSVVITDANGCQNVPVGIVINQPPQTLLANGTSQNVSCFAGNNGSASTAPSGGTPPYTYQWSTGATTQNITGLSAGNYSVTVSDGSCQPYGLQLVNNGGFESGNTGFTSAYSYCNSANCLNPEGRYAIGSNPNFFHTNFAGSPNSGNNFLIVNGIGSPNTSVWCQTITVQPNTNYNFSTWVTSVHPSSPANLQFSINGSTIGNIFQAPSATNVWLQFFATWNSGANTTATICIVNQNTTASGNDFGLDNISFMECITCTATQNFTITQPDELNITTAPTDITCNGLNNGVATATVTGGTAPYNVTWSNGQTGLTASNLAPGTYTVTVVDANNCTTNTSVTITQPAVLNATASVTSDYNGQGISCNGASTGNITANPTGGTAPYTYLWSNGATSQSQSGLTAGTYSVTVTDFNGCTTNASVTLINPPVLTSTTNITTSISCFGGSNGVITVTPTGGVAPYTYLWSNGSTAQNPSGLSVGTYSVTITDNNGCIATDSVILAEPTELNTSASITTDYNGHPISCNDSSGTSANGSITVNPTGGTAPYSYAWSNGANTQNVNGVGAGSYTVTVTDAGGCTSLSSVTIVAPPPVTASATVTTDYNGQGVSCNGAADGSVSVTPGGGTAPYTYLWSNGSTLSNPSGLTAGTYNVTITDANGCIATSTAIVTEPNENLSGIASVTSNYNGQHVSCIGSTDGSITVSPSGGTAPYTYSWSNGSTSQSVSGVGAGVYNVNITDVNGCSANASITVSEPTLVTSSASVTSDYNGQDISCNSASGVPANGNITVASSGGTAPYTYSWSNGSTTQSVSGVGAGTYTVIVTDANGCSSTSSVTLTEPPVLTSSSSVNSNYNGQDISCFGATDGIVTVTPVGGTAPYTFAWSNGATTQTVSGLGTGTYSVIITDANGCTITSSTTLSQPVAPVSATASVTSNYNGQDVSCNSLLGGAPDGSLTVTPTGGTAPYTYLWSNGSTSQNPTGIGAGLYNVTVTDVNGCTMNTSVTVTEPPVLSSTSAVTSNYNGQDISCNGGSDASISVTPVGGTSPYTYSWSNGATTQGVSGLAAGTYSVIVTDANGCETTSSVTVTEPAQPLSATATVTSNYNGQNISCNGAADGAVSAFPVGGTAPYSYLWSNGSTSQNPSGLTAGTYLVTVTDVNGCSTTASVTVNEPTVVTSSASVDSDYNGQNVSCNSTMGGVSDGVISATPTGGTTPYTYAWSNGSTNQTVNGVGAGTYNVVITDANGCTSSSSVTITEPPVLTSSSSVTSDYNGQNISCNGAADGAVSVFPVGGTAPYSYLWSNGSTVQAPSGLSAGTYTVTVTDANGCVTNSSVTVTQPAFAVDGTAFVTSDYNGQDVSCVGSTDGSISVTPNGGTAPYTYVWSNGSTSQSVTGLGAGTYSVTITDINGCTATASVTLVNPPVLSTTASVVSDYNGQNISCNSSMGGIPDGVVTTTPVGGTAPYTYSWDNGAITQTVNNVGAGTYTVTVTDVNGCNVTANVTITEPPTLTSTSDVTSNYNGQQISCNGATDGAVTVTPNGGTAPYTYAWSNGSTSQSPSGLGAGTYTVTITDANGCTSNSSVTVTEPTFALTTTAQVISDYNGQDVSCNGTAGGTPDGIVSATPDGGTAPYTYSWDNGATTQTVNNVGAGTYTVTVTDVNGCSTTASVTVSEPPTLTSSTDVTSDYNGQQVSCNGATDGAVTVTPNGGTAPYTYAWSNGSTSQSPSGLGAGTYTVTITDANGCTSNSSVTVTEPTFALTTTAQVISDYNGQDVSCNGTAGGTPDGIVSATPTGGTAPYTYSWDNGATTQTVNNVGAGTYTVTVTDVNGCSTAASVTVTEPPTLTSSTDVTSNYNGQQVSCNGATDGAVTVTPNGGTAPYTYAWSNGSTAQSPSGLGAGTYTVVITDANGCTTNSSVTVTEPAFALTTTAQVISDYNGQDVSCNGTAGGTPDGIVSATPTGGTAPYTYSWDNGVTTQTVNNVGAGTYTVTVTDVNGCSTTANVTVTEPPTLTSTTNVTSNYNGQDISCNGAADGSVSVTPGGGTTPYSYLWNNGSVQASISGLTAGTYSVIITDVNGCTTTSSVIVTQPAQPVSVSASVTSNFNGQDVSCNGSSDGVISATPNGGTAPYVYTWSNGSTTQNASGVAAGTYTVTATDVNGCSATGTVIVTEPSILTTSSAVTSNYNGQDVSCNGIAGGTPDGSISVMPTGGTAPYTYSWDNGSTLQNPTGVGAGTYTATVTDVNGCTSVSTITVSEPPVLTSTTDVISDYNGQQVSCNGATDGAVTVTPNGGTAPYTYAWSNGSTQQSPSGLGAGTYTVTITDANGCTSNSSVTVTEPAFALTTTAQVISDYNGQDVSCNGTAGGTPDAIISATPAGGTAPYTYSWDNGATTQTVNNVGAGTYTVTVTDVNGCSTTASVTVTEPPTLTSSTDVTSSYNGQQVSCNGATDGAVTVTPNGGTAPYTYAWSSGSTSQSPSGLGAGTYTVTITDANGCTSNSSVTVTEPTFALTTTAQVISDYNGQDVSCNGTAGGTPDGIVSATPNGGTAPYTYSWDNGATTQTVNNVGAGTYTVTVTDVNGCSTAASVTVTEPPTLTSSTDVTSDYNGQQVSCNGATDGAVTVTPNGGTAPYTYAWSNGSTAQSPSGLGAGTYTVVITDANGCMSNSSVTVTEPAFALTTTAQVISDYNGQDVSCNGSADGAVTVTPNGGTAPYTYAWDNGSISQSPSGLGAGTYTVTVTDVNGCNTGTSVTVTEPIILTTSSAVTSNYNGQDVSCNGIAGGTPDGSISVMPTGGTAPYTYSWDNGSTLQNPTGVGAGTYTATVTDVNGCTSISTVTVSEPPVLTSSTDVTSNYNGQQISCNGATDGAVTVTPNGGTAPYTYAWSNGSTEQSPSGLGAGTYTVTITDANGCTSNSSVTVTEPAFALTTTAQVISDYNGQDVSCNGTAGGTPDGIISATPAGGTAPYTYSWDNGATTQTVSNVGAGTHTVTVTDVNGCSTTASVTVTEPPTLTSSTDVTSNYNGQQVSCNGATDGAVTVTPNGGTAPYTYAWSSGSTSQSPSGLGAGTYTVVITDANGCTSNSSVIVTEPAFALTTTAQVISDYNGQDVSCNGTAGGTPDGIISATPAGGTAPYTYSWDNGATTQTVNNVGAGTYTVTVTDVNGCSTTASVTVTEPPTLTSSTDVTSNYNGQQVSCNGATDGAVTVTPNGGTAPYTYAWSNGSTSQSPSGLGAGTYTVVITDANGCMSNSSVTVTEPAVIVSAIANVISNYNGQHVSCNGSTDGIISVTPNGGTAPYTYLWNNSITTQTNSNVSAGNYSVTVADVNGCLTNASVVVSEPNILITASSVTSNYNGQDVSCNSASNGTPDGSIITIPSGGTAPYSYSWSNGSNSQNPTGIGAGNYTVTITDANGCVVNSAVVVTEPDVFTTSTSVASNYNGENISCNGGTDGAIMVSPVGGTAPYSYQWNNGSTLQNPSGLGAGNYSVTVTDANGCTSSSNITITQPTAIQLGATVTNVLCFGNNTGEIDLAVMGGVPGYSYNWTNAQTTQDVTGLTAGTYTVNVVDANGCPASLTTVVTQPNQSMHASVAVTNVSCFGGNNGSLIASGSGGAGSYTYQWTNGPATALYNGLAVGTYEVTVSDVNGCQVVLSGNVAQPAAAISVSGVVSPVLCYGGNTGSVNITVTGGTSGYTYQWTNGQQTPNISGLTAGNYTLTVTDANGCTNSSYTANVTQPIGALDVSGQLSHVKCYQGSDGAIDITTTGGTSPYTYSWSHGGDSEDIMNLPAGTYSVNVTDANGCNNASYAGTIIQPSTSINITGSTNHLGCSNGSDGSISIDISGGEPVYSINWSNGATSSTINNLSAGIYTVNVNDTRGCQRSANFQVLAPPQLAIAGHVQDNLCYGVRDGGINITVSGGTPGYQYDWSNGSSSEDIYNAIPGSYTVRVTDSKGCERTATFSIFEAPQMTIALDSLHQIFVGESVVLDAIVQGGTGSYTYQWTPEDYLSCPTCGTTTASPVANTNYVVTVTDGNNCMVTTNAHVIVNHDIFIPNAFTPNGNGTNDVFKPVVRMAKECSFSIYNRWGELLYSTLDINQGWDGTVAGVDAKMDVYVYLVKVIFLNGDEQTFNGKVTLLR